MADKRLRTKTEIKRFFTNLKGKPITDDMISILIDVLWRNRSNMRTSGFRLSGGLDAVISFDIPSRRHHRCALDQLVWQPGMGDIASGHEDFRSGPCRTENGGGKQSGQDGFHGGMRRFTWRVSG